MTKPCLLRNRCFWLHVKHHAYLVDYEKQPHMVEDVSCLIPSIFGFVMQLTFICRSHSQWCWCWCYLVRRQLRGQWKGCDSDWWGTCHAASRVVDIVGNLNAIDGFGDGTILALLGAVRQRPLTLIHREGCTEGRGGRIGRSLLNGVIHQSHSRGVALIKM